MFHNTIQFSICVLCKTDSHVLVSPAPIIISDKSA